MGVGLDAVTKQVDNVMGLPAILALDSRRRDDTLYLSGTHSDWRTE